MQGRERSRPLGLNPVLKFGSVLKVNAAPADTSTGHVHAQAASGSLNLNIHGARGLFSFLLFLYHVANSRLPPPPIPFVEGYQVAATSLAFGVDLFFAISGIVILGAFRRAPSLRSFIFDRATRILPVLWVTTTLVLVLLLLGRDKFSTFTPVEIGAVYLANLFALPPIVWLPMVHPAAWSLSYEFAFYLLIALFGALSGHLDRRWALALVVLLAISVFWLHTRAIFFLVGLIIASGWMERPELKPLLRFPLLWMVVFFASWQGVAMLVGGSIFDAVVTRLIGDPLLVCLTLCAFVSALFAMSSIHQGLGWLSRALRSPPMLWLGTISFSLYLWQTPIMAVVKRGMEMVGLVAAAGSLSQPLFLVLALPPTLIVSHYSQRVLEIGVTNRLRRLRLAGAAVRVQGSA